MIYFSTLLIIISIVFANTNIIDEDEGNAAPPLVTEEFYVVEPMHNKFWDTPTYPKNKNPKKKLIRLTKEKYNK